MREKMDFLWLKATSKMRSFWEDFKHEEKGAAEIVAIIMIIVVVIAVAGIFHKQIGRVIESAFGKVDTFIQSPGL